MGEETIADEITGPPAEERDDQAASEGTEAEVVEEGDLEDAPAEGADDVPEPEDDDDGTDS